MPFPLPWFDNKVDPLLPQPQNLKPLLYAFDDYQTYDLLWYIPASKGLWLFLLRHFRANLPVSAPNLPYSQAETYDDFTSISEPVGWTFFERFTPWNYSWAEEYSTKYFFLIQQYCRRYNYYFYKIDYYETRQLKYLPDLPILQQSTTDEYAASQKFTFSFNAQEPQTIVLTWLEFQGWEVTKRYRIIELYQGENTITLLFPGYFCACSMVVSGEDITNIEQAIDQANSGILYKNLDKLFEEIDNLIGYPEEAQEPVPDRARQEWAYWTKLIYANNNYWGNQINIDISKDLGKPIFFTPVYQNGLLTDIICHLWGQYLFSVHKNDLQAYEPGLEGVPYAHSFRSNIIKGYNEIFTESEQEALNQQLESFLIINEIAIPQNVVMDFLDAKKKLELQQNA